LKIIKRSNSLHKTFPFFQNLHSELNHKQFIKILRQISFYSGGNFVAQLIMMIYAILVARALTPFQLGIYSGLYANLGISISLVNFGLDIWMLNETQFHNSLRELAGKVISIKLLFGLIWFILCLLLLPITQPNIFSHILVLIALADIFSESLTKTILIAWNIQRKIKLINTIQLISRFGKIVVLILLIYIDNISHVSIISSRFVISFSSLLASVIILKPIIKGGNFFPVIRIIKNSLYFGISEILAIIYGNIDITILTYYSISETGYYSPAIGIIHALFIIPNSIYTFLLPKVATSKSLHSRTGLRNLTLKVFLLFSLIGTALGISLLISGEYFVTFILGQSYLLTGELLTLLSPILLLKSISFGLALIIIVTGGQRKRLLPQLIVAFLKIILCVLLIPIYGVISVTWVYIVSETTLLIGYGYIVLKTLHNKYN